MSENRWGSMGGDEDRDYYKTRAELLKTRAELLTARLEKVEAELKQQRNVDIEAVHDNAVKMEQLEAERDKLKAHKGDPCIYCGTAHDDVAPGPCLADREYLRAERDSLKGIVKPLMARLGVDYLGLVLPTVSAIIEALEWYADEAHYYNTGAETAMDDKGQRARRALKRKEDGLNVR